MKIVVFDELIEVNAEHFEADEDVGAESEGIFYSYDVLHVVVVIVTKSFQYFNFDLALLMKFLPILKNFQCHHFLILVVVAADDDAESTLAELLLNFISVINLLFSFV